ncbi:hypothetical protein ACSTS3_22745 [Aquimarina muelleri]|uniref:hypothetical protein n=1 Tax=Aquimarina muelleri TaxID=279356 RepID=UPI003F68746D
MRYIYVILLTVLLSSCKEGQSQNSYSGYDFLDAQNYLEEFTVFNDWFITSTFCKRKDNLEMEFSADIYLKYHDELKWKKNKHWYKNEEYIVSIDGTNIMKFDNEYLYNNFDMWAIVITDEYFLNHSETDNSCNDIKENTEYKIYYSQAKNKQWQLIEKTFHSDRVKEIINQETSKLNFKYNKTPNLDLIEIDNSDLNFIGGTYKINCTDETFDPLIYNYDKNSSYIDLFNKEDMQARIISSILKNKNSTDKKYYYKYDMLAGITRYNDKLNWNEISKDSIIAKVEAVGKGKLKLWWYGFYDAKQQKRVHLVSDFNTIGEENPVTLVKCED